MSADPVGVLPFSITVDGNGVSCNGGPPHREFQIFWGGLSVVARKGRFPSDGNRLTILRGDDVLMDIEHAELLKASGRDGVVSVDWSKGGSVSYKCLSLRA